MPNILEVENLSKSFGARPIINNLSFSVESGTSIAITGPSGCGKSTLLNMIGMLEAPSSGSIKLDGKVLPKPNSSEATKLRRHKINYLFQSFALITDSSAVENAMLGMHHTKATKSEKLEAINRIFERLGLSQVSNDKVSTLSGGEQQRLALARCILKNGDLILADEPTGSLDQELASCVLDEMLKLQHEHNKTLLVVTHDPKVAERCDRILQLVPVAEQ
ncbi:ABC transporter ATP-binding protein [Canibacter sp. lx-45]|uniref:ABC transporter ATP-binding protein n=1 Tax=Canibacter zhuwentaonis TaxID=2837491 RepID=UPI001BDCB6D2|nr:ABC transporter ATP-binding protein [Canibacter zhuwentaonis]MBT1035783.1 ABC transporter ATP-binding protein [Canibacter zhuwentaonis]